MPICLDVEDKFVYRMRLKARVVIFRYGVQGEREERSLSSVTRYSWSKRSVSATTQAASAVQDESESRVQHTRCVRAT